MLISVCIDWIAGGDRWFGDVYSEGLYKMGWECHYLKMEQAIMAKEGSFVILSKYIYIYITSALANYRISKPKVSLQICGSGVCVKW